MPEQLPSGRARESNRRFVYFAPMVTKLFRYQVAMAAKKVGARKLTASDFYMPDLNLYLRIYYF